MRSISQKAFIPLIEFQKEKKDRRCTFWLRITTLPSRIRDSITLALPGRNWPFLFVRRSRAPPWEVNIPVASIPTFKAFPADIDRRDTVFRDTLSYFFYGPRLAPWYHSRTPFTTYRTALGNARRGYGVSRSMISLSGTREIYACVEVHLSNGRLKRVDLHVCTKRNIFGTIIKLDIIKLS